MKTKNNDDIIALTEAAREAAYIDYIYASRLRKALEANAADAHVITDNWAVFNAIRNTYDAACVSAREARKNSSKIN